jgi:hypothetical protein
VSLTLVVLAALILVVELFRIGGPYLRIVLVSVLALFCVIIQRLSASLLGASPTEIGTHRAT